MSIEIQPLPREKWQGYEIPFRYETANVYDTEITQTADGFYAAFAKKTLSAPS